jgi:hypothetical protein
VRSARHWHDRAEEAWSMASRMIDPKAKTALVEIAQRYDLLADRALVSEARVDRTDGRRREPASPFH